MTQEVNSLEQLLAEIASVEDQRLYRPMLPNTAEEWKGPSPRFTAIMAISAWVGLGIWRDVSGQAKTIECPVCFREYVWDFGIEGWLVEVWYDYHWGEGKFATELPKAEAMHEKKAYDAGFEAGTLVLKRLDGEGPQGIEYGGSTFGRAFFFEGVRDALESGHNKFGKVQ